MSCVFQNLAGFQNRYPLNQWQKILGNRDVQYFPGRTDELTAKFISSHTGLTSAAVSNKSKQLGAWRISNYTPEYREAGGAGKHPVLTPDEVLRLPTDQALIIVRGEKASKINKLDYSEHPEYPRFQSCEASTHILEWHKLEQEAQDMAKARPKTLKRAAARKSKETRVQTVAEEAAPAEPEVIFTVDIITPGEDSILS